MTKKPKTSVKKKPSQKIHVPQSKVVPKKSRIHFLHYLKLPLWFCLGIALGLFFLLSFLFIFYQRSHEQTNYAGVMVNNEAVGGKTKEEVRAYFAAKNDQVQKSVFTFRSGDMVATVSAKQIGLGYDENLIAEQAYSVARSSNLFSNISLMVQAYTKGINIPATIRYDDKKLTSIMAPLSSQITINPVDARFTFQNGRVTEFRPSIDGRTIDFDQMNTIVKKKVFAIANTNTPQAVTIAIPIRLLKPTMTTEKVNNLGIKELVASGTSLFHGSIENRVYNIGLAASKLNGILIPPNTVFSFDNAIGDISSLSGYKQAYVIENGRTVLGDGGGVCQVSTTFFRAILAGGFPILERNPHAYRVHYYEEDSDPGIDAAIYWPTVDLKFKNDSEHYLLVQTVFDPQTERLTFNLYGTKDNREVTMTKPVILSQTPPPPALYQDDPTLPKGQVKQVDFEAWGANVYFTRTVKKDGNVIISEKFTSNYRPWQAIFLRGTQ